MFDWILNTSLADDGSKSKLLKKKLKVLNFTLDTLGRRFVIIVGVFRTQLNICNRAFLRKYLTTKNY